MYLGEVVTVACWKLSSLCQGLVAGSEKDKRRGKGS